MWTQELGRDGNEYWDLTARTIDACIKAYYRTVELDNIRAGMICAQIWNAQPADKRRRAKTWSDFFVPMTKHRKKRKTLEQQREEFYLEHRAQKARHNG